MESLIKMSPMFQSAKQSGDPLALKIEQKGWRTLSSSQRKRARQRFGVASPPLMMVPTRPKASLARARPTKQGPGLAGKTATISKCELLQDVQKGIGNAPLVQSWVINPASARTFNQAQLMSTGYNKYRITSLRIRYTPSCGFETSGMLALGFNSDSSDALPETKTELYGMKYTAETAARSPVIFQIPTDSTVRYCRDSAADDPKLVDFGRLVLMTYGSDDTDPSILGELFIEYTVVFSDPTFISHITQQARGSSWKGPGYADHTATATQTQFELRAGGRWLLVWNSDVALTSPKLSGATGNIKTSGDSKMGIATLTAPGSGATVTATTLSQPQAIDWFVARM